MSAQPNWYFVYDVSGFYSAGQTVPGAGGGVVPTGISGTAIETYQSRVWAANGPSVSYSAPASVVNFTGAAGGGSFTSNDPSLRIAYSQLKAANGYLYLFGDSSISYLANPQTSGAPLVTTFSLQNVDPEIGTAWPNTVDVIGSNLVFANAWGAQVSQGGRVVKISDQLDGIYNTVPNFGGLTPTAAKAIMFGRRVWVLLLPVVDQVTGQQTNKMFIWDTKSWCSASQSAAVTSIQHQEISSVLTAWGTDGKSLYRLFQTPSTAVAKTIQSKFWAPYTYARVKAANRLWGLARVFGAQTAALTVSVDSEYGASAVTVALAPLVANWVNNAGVPAIWTNNAGAIVIWSNGADATLVWPPEACAQNGALMGLTISTNAADVSLISVSVMPVDVGYRG